MLAIPEATAGDDACREGHAALTDGKDEKALERFSFSYALGCRHPMIYEGWAKALRNLGRIDEALRCLDFGIAKNPGHASLRFVRSLLLLGMKNFREGWDDYELRNMNPMRCYGTRTVEFPRWKGQPIAGKKLLVWGEQGFGDEIMFSSLYAELHYKHKAQLYIECSRELYSIFSRSFPFALVLTREAGGEMNAVFRNTQFDYEIPAGSLPGLLRRDEKDFLARTPFLKSCPYGYNGLKKSVNVGISWRGGTDLTRQKSRTIRLEQLAPILSIRCFTGIRFVNLQHDVTDEELNMLRARDAFIFPWTFDNAVDALSQCQALVSVCNTNVHLAGALDVPTLCLAPFAPEWRYGFTGEKMPWYRSVTVCRQHKPGEWERVIFDAAASLRDLLELP